MGAEKYDEPLHPGVYGHYKGGRYTVLFLARDSTNDWGVAEYVKWLARPLASQTERFPHLQQLLKAVAAIMEQDPPDATHAPVVIYYAHAHPDSPCVRLASEWIEPIEWPDGVTRPRFCPIGRLPPEMRDRLGK